MGRVHSSVAELGKMGEDEIHGEVRWDLQSRKKSDGSRERYTNFDEGRDWVGTSIEAPPCEFSL